jgi:Ca-activated chloride channel family protein
MTSFESAIDFIINLNFVWPWMIAFIPLPLLINRLIKPVSKQHSPLLAPQIVSRVESELPEEFLVEINQTRLGIPLLAWLLWISLLIAATRPVLYMDSTPFQISGKEIVLAVDLSGSMEKVDMYLEGEEVNRLVAVKDVVNDFISQRQGDRMGLVVFGTQAFLQSPLTYDLETVKALLAEAEIGMAGQNTAIGDAIGLTLKHFKENKLGTKTQSAVLILLTDGSNTAGVVNPLESAEKSQEMGLKIYTVGVGKVKNRTGLDRFLSSRSDMDVETLTQIAETTGGQFFQANDTEQLGEIYQYINELESVDHDVFSYRLRTEFYYWPLGFGFLFSMLLAWQQLRRMGA